MNANEGTRRLSILVSEPLQAELTAMAERYGETIADFVRQALVREIERRTNAELEKTAEALYVLYETDEELHALTSLDGEEFL